jgi:hypothetical protein
MLPSIFNDVIGPVMRGPSSSHCAAALRIGRLARDLMGGEFDTVLVEFDRNGSLPTTHDTQGSDMGRCGGLMGGDAVDPRLPESLRILQESGVGIAMETVDAGDPHPNAYRLTRFTPTATSAPVPLSNTAAPNGPPSRDGRYRPQVRRRSASAPRRSAARLWPASARLPMRGGVPRLLVAPCGSNGHWTKVVRSVA